MNEDRIMRLAQQLTAGEVGLDAFLAQVHAAGQARLAVATIDLDRRRRCGFPEVVYGEGKSVETLAEVFRSLLDADADVLATRVDPVKAEQLVQRFPAAGYNPLGRTLRIDGNRRAGETKGRVALITAGTSDLPVAEEARETLQWMNVAVATVHDVGVAGPHRLPARLSEIEDCDAVVVIAGMEGALPSIVGGYVSCPVVGVPTSVGYGANFGGVSALLGMLNSCAANVTVVNIDAGFKGAYIAGLIAAGKRQSAG